MLRVTIEFIPLGVESMKKEIARMEIVNTADHENRPHRGNYSAKVVTRAPNGDLHASTRRILDFDRMRGNAWRLVHAVLEALGEEGMEGEPSDEHRLGRGADGSEAHPPGDDATPR